MPLPTLTPVPAVTPLPTATPQPTATLPPGLKGFRIVGYVTDGETIANLVPFDKLTHINYAFLLPKADGTVQDVANTWKLDQLVALAHGQGVKVIISVGGWGYAEPFQALAAKPETRAIFVAALRRYVQAHALDGVDIDWEYPTGEAEAQDFLALMQALRAALQPEGKLLTAAVAALGANADGVLKGVFDQVDFLNLMVYDGPDTNHSPYSFAEAALDYWSARGLSPEKTVLGVPFYAKPGWTIYSKLIQANPAAANTDVLDYMGQKVYYNGIPTLQQKTHLALKRASGIMIWALPMDTYDDTSLLKAIYTAALH